MSKKKSRSKQKLDPEPKVLEAHLVMGVSENFTESIRLPPPRGGSLNERPEDIYGQGQTRELALRDLVRRCAGEVQVYKAALRTAFAELGYMKEEWRAENAFKRRHLEKLTKDEIEAYKLSNGQY